MLISILALRSCLFCASNVLSMMLGLSCLVLSCFVHTNVHD